MRGRHASSTRESGHSLHLQRSYISAIAYGSVDEKGRDTTARPSRDRDDREESYMKRTVAAVWGAVCIAGAALAIPATTASAGSPNPITVAPGAPQSYSGSVSPGWTDPNGPPAPSALCSSNANGTEPCDRESVKLA